MGTLKRWFDIALSEEERDGIKGIQRSCRTPEEPAASISKDDGCKYIVFHKV